MDDASSQLPLEAQILTLQAELAAARRDAHEARQALDALSASISHDLRAPLRAIDGFARILGEQHAAQLDDEGKRLLDNVRRNARRQSALLEELLAFMALERGALHVGDVDMHRLAEESWKREREREPQRTAELRLADLPTVRGDEALLRKLWSCLLGNALKFTRRHKHAVVEVRGELIDGQAIFQVKDNGVGFDMAYASKLFGLFQRLHHERDFEGLGVGLASAQRILARHGGTIRADAAVDRGATVTFALPGA
jgi:light-regulated signal transduction histidine kinase (bacteriophytochrome)